MEPPEIACSLTAVDLPARLEEWRTLLSSVVERVDIEGGVRLRLEPGVSAAAVAGLAARELECCPFFSFGLFMSSRGLVIEVRAPEGAEALVTALLGEAPAAPACGCSSS
jgi:MerR family transcriptional regulator, copper efflux regulator